MTQAKGEPPRDQFERETPELLREIRSQIRWPGTILLGLALLAVVVAVIN